MRNLLEEAGNTIPTQQEKPNVWFKWSKDLDNQTLTGFLVKDAQGEGFFYRHELQSESEQKSEIVDSGTSGAKKAYYVQILVVKSPNESDIEQVRVVKISPNLMSDLITQLKGDEDLGLDPLEPYADGAEVLISINKSGKKLATKYSVSVLRNAKTKKPKLYAEIDNFAKLLGLE